MVDSLTLLFAVIIIVSLMFIFGVQKTSSYCGHVFQMPSPKILKQYMPRGTQMSNKMQAAMQTDAAVEEAKKNTANATENLNDMVNERFLNNPVKKFHQSVGFQNDKGPDGLMWMSVRSQSGTSNDGRVAEEKNARDITTPDYLNNQMNNLTGLMASQMNRSKVADYMHEIV